MRWINPLKLVRAALPAAFILLLLACAGCFVYVWVWGIPQTYQQLIVERMRSYTGLDIRIANIKFDPFKGLVAEEVNVKGKLSSINAKKLSIDADFFALYNKRIDLRGLQLHQAEVVLQLPNIKQSLKLEQIDCQLDIISPQQFTLHDCQGKLAGMDFKLLANLSMGKKPQAGTAPSSPSLDLAEYEKSIDYAKLEQFYHSLQQIRWDSSRPPLLDVRVSGDITSPREMLVSLNLHASALEYDRLEISQLDVQADYNQGIVNIAELSVSSGYSKFSAKANLDIDSRVLDFDATSNVDVARLQQLLPGKSDWSDLKPEGLLELGCSGSLNFKQGWTEMPLYKAIGQFSLGKLGYKHLQFEQIGSDFSLNNDDWYVDNFSCKHQGKQLKARLLAKDGIYKLEADSTLNPKPFAALIKNDFLAKEMRAIDWSSKSSCNLEVKAQASRNNPAKSFEARMQVKIKDARYYGVDLDEVTTGLQVTPKLTVFEKPEINFAPVRGRGDNRAGVARAERIQAFWQDDYIKVDDFRAQVWPVDFLKLFTTSIAEFCEMFDFKRMPSVSGSGSIDWSDRHQRMNASLNFRNVSRVNIDIDKDMSLPFSSGQFDLRILPTNTQVNNIKANIWGGSTAANLKFFYKGKGGYEGEVVVNKLIITEIIRHFGQKASEPGTVTGKIRLFSKNYRLAQLEATGLAGLYGGDLLEVPFFGPLTPLLDKTIGVIPGVGSLTGAKLTDATCPFFIKDGWLCYDDFLSQAGGLKLTGSGRINLDKGNIQSHFRLHTRGLLGLITLPLTPLGGIFIFEVQGKLNDPRWELTPFARERNRPR